MKLWSQCLAFQSLILDNHGVTVSMIIDVNGNPLKQKWSPPNYTNSKKEEEEKKKSSLRTVRNILSSVGASIDDACEKTSLRLLH